jgi:hypothetical protein
VFEDAIVADGAEDFSIKVIEAGDLSTKELAVELGEERLSERDELVGEAGRGGLMSAD